MLVWIYTTNTTDIQKKQANMAIVIGKKKERQSKNVDFTAILVQSGVSEDIAITCDDKSLIGDVKCRTF